MYVLPKRLPSQKLTILKKWEKIGRSQVYYAWSLARLVFALIYVKQMILLYIWICSCKGNGPGRRDHQFPLLCL